MLFMKKLFVSILAFLYITSSCEATVYLHYCMGKAVSFSFLPDQSKNCQRCGMKKSAGGMGCCKEEQKLVKSDKSQKLTDLNASTPQAKKWITIIATYASYSVQQLNTRIISHSPAHGPPGLKPVAVYLMNRLFLI
jgi:hypothetical protein